MVFLAFLPGLPSGPPPLFDAVVRTSSAGFGVSGSAVLFLFWTFTIRTLAAFCDLGVSFGNTMGAASTGVFTAACNKSAYDFSFFVTFTTCTLFLLGMGVSSGNRMGAASAVVFAAFIASFSTFLFSALVNFPGCFPTSLLRTFGGLTDGAISCDGCAGAGGGVGNMCRGAGGGVGSTCRGAGGGFGSGGGGGFGGGGEGVVAETGSGFGSPF